MTPTPEQIAAANRLHLQIRWLLAQLDTDATVQDVIGALMYETVSLTAEMSATKREAFQAIAGFMQVALEQIDAYGVGKPHP